MVGGLPISVLSELLPSALTGFEPEVVEDEQVRVGVAGEPSLTRAVGAAACEVGEHLVGAHEEDFVAPASGTRSPSIRQKAR